MKKTYSISLFAGCTGLPEQIAIIAAKSNGGGDYVSLEQMKGIVDSQKMLYPVSNEGVQCTFIGGNTLHIDKPVSGHDLPQTVLIIEEKEVYELQEEFLGYGALAD